MPFYRSAKRYLAFDKTLDHTAVCPRAINMHHTKEKFFFRNFFPIDLKGTGAWIRGTGVIHLDGKAAPQTISVSGTFSKPTQPIRSRLIRKRIGFSVYLGRKRITKVKDIQSDSFDFEFPVAGKYQRRNQKGYSIRIRPTKLTLIPGLSLLGLIAEKLPIVPGKIREGLSPFSKHSTYRHLLLVRLQVDGRMVLDFTRMNDGLSRDYIRNNANQGVNLIGWFKGYLGIGESVRACARSCLSVGLDYDAINMNLHLEGDQSDELWDGKCSRYGRQPITIVHADAPQSFDLIRKHRKELSKNRYRIGYWAWELPEFPDGWIQYASVYDEIWCPSDFCRNAMFPKLPCPVITMPHSIKMESVSDDFHGLRSEMNLPKDKFLFLCCFDLGSYAPRKNPEAVIEAFLIACRDRSFADKAGLVLKMHGVDRSNLHRELIRELKAEIPELYVIDRSLSRRKLTELQKCCDCFVSLHRSEGFGLSVAECMALGKPVISTDWSATSEYLDSETGCPVEFELVEIEESVGPYTKGQRWANPDIHHAASWMKRLLNDEPYRTEISKNAAIRIDNLFSPERIGRRYMERLTTIALY